MVVARTSPHPGASSASAIIVSYSRMESDKLDGNGSYQGESRSQPIYVTILIVDEERRIHEFLVPELRSQPQSAVARLSGYHYAKVVALLEDVRISFSLGFNEKRRRVLDEFVTHYLSTLFECYNSIFHSKSLVGLDLLPCGDSRMLLGYRFLTLLRDHAQKGQLQHSLPHACCILTRVNEAIASEAIA